jgi:hypothetical protein
LFLAKLLGLAGLERLLRTRLEGLLSVESSLSRLRHETSLRVSLLSIALLSVALLALISSIPCLLTILLPLVVSLIASGICSLFLGVRVVAGSSLLRLLLRLSGLARDETLSWDELERSGVHVVRHAGRRFVVTSILVKQPKT